MPQQTINNGELGADVRSKLNSNFTELYAALAPSLPAGMVASFAQNNAPSGWLACSGQAVSRTDFATLFAAIGTTYGAGNGTTTFNVPDLRAEFIRGWDNSRGVDTGRVFGSAQAQATQAHSHQWWDYTGGGGNTLDAFSPGGSFWNSSGSPVANFSDPFSNDAWTSPTLSAVSGETRPRNVAMLYCIKT